MSVKIYIVNHQPFSYQVSGDVLTPIVVGHSDHLIDARDEFADTRAHYWVWREGMRDGGHVGFHHYRRAFLYQPLINGGDEQRLSEAMYRDLFAQVVNVTAREFVAYLARLDCQSSEAWGWLDATDIVVSRPMPVASVAAHYRQAHRAEDWEIFAHLLRGEGLDDGRLPHLTALNMFVMRAELFDEWMTLWWCVMQKADALVSAPAYGYQRRVFAYLSERLFTSWLYRLRCERPALRVETLPVLFCPEMT